MRSLRFHAGARERGTINVDFRDGAEQHHEQGHNHSHPPRPAPRVFCGRLRTNRDAWRVQLAGRAGGKTAEKLVLIQMNNKWGYINAQGEIVFPPRFDWAGGFDVNDLAWVREKGKTTYINASCEVVVALRGKTKRAATKS